MGAFNEWVAGSFMEQPDRRQTATVARNILLGAAAITRATTLRCQGFRLPAEALQCKPLEDAQIKEYLR